MATVSGTIEIAVPPEAVFDAVTHLERMGEFSPENTGGRWIGGAAGPALGARFRGANEHGTRKWRTAVRVVGFEPPTHFAFAVSVGPLKVARWTYVISPTESGSSVTEEWLDQRSSLSRKVSSRIVADRETFTRESIDTTLRRLKACLEG